MEVLAVMAGILYIPLVALSQVTRRYLRAKKSPERKRSGLFHSFQFLFCVI